MNFYTNEDQIERLGITSVPDAPCAMMRNTFCSLGLQFFHGIVKEKVYQDRIDVER